MDRIQRQEQSWCITQEVLQKQVHESPGATGWGVGEMHRGCVGRSWVTQEVTQLCMESRRPPNLSRFLFHPHKNQSFPGAHSILALSIM